MKVTAHARLNKDRLVAYLRNLPSELVGNHGELKSVFASAFAHALFTKIAKAYEIKSAGGTDELGYKWKDLKPTTKAYRKLKSGELSSMGIQGKRQRGLLTPSQNKQWKAIFASTMKKLIARGMGVDEAKGKAAQVAWSIMKSKGALTKLSVLGNRKVPILRVSDRLYKSLSPGTLSGGRYYKPANQVFEIQGKTITLGSSVPYAAKQHKTRPLFPSINKIKPWLLEAAVVGSNAALEHVRSVVERKR